MGTRIHELLEITKMIQTCQIHPPEGFPILQEQHLLPDDLKEFYEMCGGIDLFVDSGFPSRIPPPSQVRLANDVLFKDMSSEEKKKTRQHISWSWYIIVEAPSSQYITIDLAPERLGQCYNSSWLYHPGNSYIVAQSFTNMLDRLIGARGHTEFWEEVVDRQSPYDDG